MCDWGVQFIWGGIPISLIVLVLWDIFPSSVDLFFFSSRCEGIEILSKFLGVVGNFFLTDDICGVCLLGGIFKTPIGRL